MDEKEHLVDTIGTTLTVLKLPGTDVIRLEQIGGRDFYISSDRVLVISIPQLATILAFLLKKGIVSRKVLEGILSGVIE